jgi:hypothetical protein
MQLALSVPASPAVSARASVRGAAVRLAAPRRAQVGRGTLAVRAGKVQLITAEELEIAIAERDKPLVIDFFARHAAEQPQRTRRLYAFATVDDAHARGFARAQLVRPVRADGRGA